jgi:hypothetical protein
VQASGELVEAKTKVEGDQLQTKGIIDRKDLGALWAIVVLFSLLCTLIGLAWQPVHYEIIPSRERDPVEARAQDSQNQALVEALNQERVRYDPETMKRIVAPRPLSEVFFLDLTRILLFPTFPLLAIAAMLRKTLRESKPSPSKEKRGRADG